MHPDNVESSPNFLGTDNSLKTHHRNLQKLVTELFEIKAGITPEIMK